MLTRAQTTTTGKSKVYHARTYDQVRTSDTRTMHMSEPLRSLHMIFRVGSHDARKAAISKRRFLTSAPSTTGKNKSKRSRRYKKCNNHTIDLYG
jgi:hypothetical protein